MRFNNLFKVAIGAILRNKTRSLLTSLGIIIGVASVILLVSIGNGFKAYINQQFESMGSNLLFVMPGKIQFKDSREGGAPGAAVNKLTVDLAREIEKLGEHVSSVLPITTTNSTAKYRSKSYNTFVVGATANYEELRDSPTSAGRFFTQAEDRRGAKVAVIGTTVVEEIFGQDSPLNKKITVGDRKYKVIGVLESKGSGVGNDQDDQIIVPITTLQRQTNTDKLTYIYIQIKDINKTKQAQKAIEQALIKEKLDEDEFSVSSAEELLSTVNQILSVLTAGLGGIAAISLLVGGIGIMNIMLVSVTERTKEIGLRKAIGARPKDILIQFLIEAVVLSLTGGIIGITLGALGSLAIRSVIKTSVTFWSILLAFTFSSLIGVVFGVWPARKASKLSPIEALRYE